MLKARTGGMDAEQSCVLESGSEWFTLRLVQMIAITCSGRTGDTERMPNGQDVGITLDQETTLSAHKTKPLTTKSR